MMNHRKAYYEHLEQAQKGNLDITLWITWFLETLKSAIETELAKTENVVLAFLRHHIDIEEILVMLPLPSLPV